MPQKDVGFDHDRFDYVPMPYEWTSTDNAGGTAENDQLIPGLKEAGADHVLFSSINTDYGDTGAVASTKVQMKFLPAQQRGLGGGDVYQTYQCLDSFQKRGIPLGARIYLGEDVTVRVKNNVANSVVRMRAFRYYAFPKRAA